MFLRTHARDNICLQIHKSSNVTHLSTLTRQLIYHNVNTRNYSRTRGNQ